jgi:hypothetical protein
LQISGKVVVAGLTCENEQLGIALGNKGALSLDRSVFASNPVHIEVSGDAVLEAQDTEFLDASGECGVHVADGKANFKKCKFSGSKHVSLFAEGEVHFEESEMRYSGRVGIVFDGNSSGYIRNSFFEGNGECACQCMKGTPQIVGNVIKEHSKFGLFLSSGSVAVVEDNKFEKNGLASVWRE